MYCTISDIQKLLPPSVTLGSTNIGTPTPGSQQVKKDQMTVDDAIYFIKFATQEVDSRLRAFYSCPLRRIKVFETDILNTISPSTNTSITVHDSGIFIKGQLVRLQSKYEYEEAIITDIPNMKTLTVDKVSNSYTIGENNIISILQFPDPIPSITTRFAISYAFDKLFSSEQAPNVSEYGKEQRKLAINDLDNILSGTILLFGQEHTGKRFVRGSLFDAYKSPTEDFQFGREKS